MKQKHAQSVYSIVFQMSEPFTIKQVIESASKEQSSNTEHIRIEASIFLEHLVALGILQQRRGLYSNSVHIKHYECPNSEPNQKCIPREATR